MTKLVRIDEVTYADLVHVTGKMMSNLGKPWSLGMSVRLAVLVLENFMQTNVWKEWVEDIKKRELLSPEDWMVAFDAMHKTMTSDESSAGP